MKIINKIGMLAVAITMLTACDKVGELPFYSNGSAVVLSASSTTIAAPPTDSLKPALTLSWTNPKYATDTSRMKFVIEIDSAGRNFSKAYSKAVVGTFAYTFTAKELNNVLLGFGFKFGQPYDIEARVISSYANNNERIVGNTIKLKATPYKIPPKVALPTTGKLYLVGGGTYFDWTNPAQMPAVRELTRLNETTWAGIFHMKGNGEYLLLPLAGDWGNKYSVNDKSLAGLSGGGKFGFNLSDNFPGNLPGGDGWYKMTYDFQEGVFTVVKVNNALSETLYVTGDATGSNWTNSPPDDQKFTQVSNGLFELTVNLTGGKAMKFLSDKGQWQPQFGGPSATGGALGANYGGGNDPANIPVNATGSYKIQVNFLTEQYTVTKL